MNRSKLYVPNPQKWIDYFKHHKPQVGKGFAIPNKPSSDRKSVTITSVSPTEQTVNQAKSELKQDGINTSELSSLIQKLNKPPEVTHPVNSVRQKQFKKTKKQNKFIKGQKFARKNKINEQKKSTKGQKTVKKKQ